MNNCNLCDMPCGYRIWCDSLCRSIEVYGLWTKEGFRKSKEPDPEAWKRWVNHRHGTPLEEVEAFSW